MQTKREYLIGLGMAKPGRGKFSNEGKAAIAKAIADGITFSDTVTQKPVSPRQPAKNEKVEREAIAPINSPYLFPSDFRYPETEYVAVENKNGKRIIHSVREACNTCRVSLTNHGCNSPTIHGNITVSMEGR